MERIELDIRRELDRFGPAGSIGRLVEVWPEAVGDAIARNSWPGRVSRDGTLHVNTSSSAWAFELSQLRPTILERLRASAPEAAPKELRFAPGPLPGPVHEEAGPTFSPPPVPSPETVDEGERLAAGIGDERLRKLVARAAAASLARASADRRF
jgi:Dna[CI] antecedent, DciA